MPLTNTEYLRRWAIAMAAALILIALPSSVSATAGDSKPRQRAERALRDGDYEGAEKAYRAMLEKNAHDHTARLGLSFALLKQRRLQDAYDHAARVITGGTPVGARSCAPGFSDPRFRKLQEFRGRISNGLDHSGE